MLASSDPGMDLASATEHCSSSISFRMGGGGAAHTAQAAPDGLT